MEHALPPRPWWRHEATGIARSEGPCTNMLALRTQSREMVCVEGGSRHGSRCPSGRLLQINRKDGCIERCVSVSTSWTGASEGPGSERAGPRLVVTHRLSWVRWSRDRLFRLLRQQDRDFCTQDRGNFVQHRGELNAPELVGRTPGKLNLWPSRSGGGDSRRAPSATSRRRSCSRRWGGDSSGPPGQDVSKQELAGPGRGLPLQAVAHCRQNCMAIAHSTGGISTYPLATPPSRVVRTEEALGLFRAGKVTSKT